MWTEQPKDTKHRRTNARKGLQDCQDHEDGGIPGNFLVHDTGAKHALLFKNF